MRRGPIVGIAATLAALLVTACGTAGAGGEGLDKVASGGVAAGLDAPGVRALPAQQTTPRRPNIVFVLMDDFSVDLLPTMRSALWMSRAGASFDHAYVVDSLCCVSRSATFTGQYPHQNRVRTNTANLPNRAGPMGGWRAFARYGNRARTFALRLQRSGYVTGYVGKYLNGYEISARNQRLPRGAPWVDGLPGDLRLGLRRVGIPEHPDDKQGPAGDPQLAGAAGVRTRARQGPVVRRRRARPPGGAVPA